MATVATIIAIILGPILAIQVQKFIERVTRERNEKRKVFMTLLTTRGRKIAPEHVQALNMIHVVYSSKKEKKEKKEDKAVVEAWDVYRDHLFNPIAPMKLQADGKVSEADEKDFLDRSNKWHEKSDEHLCNLLRKMSESLGYRFPELWLKKGAYTPQWYGDMDMNQMTISKGLADVFLGFKSFPMELTKFPVDEESTKVMKRFLQGKQPLPVRMETLPEVLDKADKENESKEA